LHKSHSLEQALRANQQLLQELQHRVKNQFSIVTHLLRMGSGQASSDETRRELGAVRDRVETLRLLNEQLYVAGTPDRLALGPFLTQLVENLLQQVSQGALHIQRDITTQDLEVTPETGFAVGLIVNEFVINSLKHAFDGQDGLVGLRLETKETGTKRLRIWDTGKGLPSEPPMRSLAPEWV
jgi:two-component sensor histidine kinase